MNTLGKILRSGCVIFTVISLAFYSLGALLASSGMIMSDNINIKFLWLFFLFSILLAFANRILTVEKVSVPLRLILHFISSGALYFLTVVVFGGFIKSGAGTLIAMALYVLIYIVCAVFITVGLLKKKKTKSEEKPYTSQFK